MAAQVIDAEEEKTPHLKFLQQGSPVLIGKKSNQNVYSVPCRISVCCIWTSPLHIITHAGECLPRWCFFGAIFLVYDFVWLRNINNKFIINNTCILDPTSFIKDVDPTAKLLSVSSKYGFAIAGVFAGTSLAFFKLSDVPHKGPIPPEKIFKFDCKTQPYHISLSPDGLTLAVWFFFSLFWT